MGGSSGSNPPYINIRVITTTTLNHSNGPKPLGNS